MQDNGTPASMPGRNIVFVKPLLPMNSLVAVCCLGTLLSVTTASGPGPIAARYRSRPSQRSISVSSPDSTDTLWYQPPFLINAGGVPLDVADASQGGDDKDAFGHAAPFLADIDGDGRPDLIVGTFSGRFRRYRNIGTNSAPTFFKDFTWLEGGGELAKVDIYCCVAAGPHLVDIDGDGIPDLTSGSYDPGAVYWWKGLGHGIYATRQMLTDENGVPLFAHLDRFKASRAYSFMSNIAWGELYGSGRPDMVLGGVMGELWIVRNLGQRHNGETPIQSQPTFAEPSSWTKITIDGGAALPDNEGHATPAIADWDGDGKLDLLVGTNAGSVYLFRNSGTTTQPEFKTRELLIPPGEGTEQWVEPGQTPRRGIRAQIQVVDYNGDGVPDILLGDWTYTETPRANLTIKDKQQLRRLRTQLAALDRSKGFDFRDWRHKWPPYISDTTALRKAEALDRQIAPYLEPVSLGPGRIEQGIRVMPAMKGHGRVWVFLNNGKTRAAEARE